ncbi:MAG TPA: 16S rRNA (guanine(527)-N(7))-methyltransferase RsmG [Allosphingosinicella sp.]|jgi:16S rRNA (guanine527-N7)-methyltransferase
MTEEEAKAALNVPHGTLKRLEALVAFLGMESERQNLVSRSSLENVWQRHILDSAQLLRFAPHASTWVDLGSGAGFPGLVVAALSSGRFTLVEARKLRVDFLIAAAQIMAIEDRVEVLHSKVEAVPPRPFEVISARAFAPLDKLLRTGLPLSNTETVWILPKGRNAKSELDAARSSWQGEFRIEPSLTDADAGIIVARGVEPKRKPGR